MKIIKLKHLHSKDKSREVREEILARALNGEEINTKELIDEYWTYKNGLQERECKDQMLGYITWLRWKLKRSYNEPFGSIDGRGIYSIPQNKDDYEVIAIRNLIRAKSTFESNRLLADKGVRKHWIEAPKTKTLPFLITSQVNPINGKNTRN